MIYKILLPVLGLFLLSGCSTKNLFKPENIEIKKGYDGTLSEPIIRVNGSAATFKSGKVLLFDNEELNLDELKFVSKSGDYIISNGDAKIIINNGDKSIEIDSKSKILSASIQGELLAVITEENSFKVFELNTKEMVFFSQGSKALAIDNRVAAPLFYEGLLFFPTLDGKIKIVDMNTKKEIRDMVIDTAKEFSNIIYLSVENNTLIIASRNILKTLKNESMFTLKTTIKDIIVDEDSIYIFQKDGKVAKLDFSLIEQKSTKFKFARFVAVGFGEKISLVEKEGYFIELDKDLESNTISKLPESAQEKVFVTKDRIIIGSKYINY